MKNPPLWIDAGLASARRRSAAAVALLALCGGAPAVAQPGPTAAHMARRDAARLELPAGAGIAEKRLGQGVSYFYEGRYALASKLIREALSLKLSHPADEAMAHQYLAFFYCLHDRAEQCEQEFRLALSGPAPMELSDTERENPAWKAVYARVKTDLPGLPPGEVVRGRFGGRIQELREHETAPASASQSVSLGKANDRRASHLQLAVEPWGDVYINQQKVAVTPPIKEISLAAGTYTIEIRNSELPAFMQTIVLKERTAYRLSYQFDLTR